jgi:hypothetical protein
MAASEEIAFPRLTSAEIDIIKPGDMGFTCLSVAPTVIPMTKATIRGVDIGALVTRTAMVQQVVSAKYPRRGKRHVFCRNAENYYPLVVGTEQVDTTGA